jgi:hypothetical protein
VIGSLPIEYLKALSSRPKKYFSEAPLWTTMFTCVTGIVGKAPSTVVLLTASVLTR